MYRNSSYDEDVKKNLKNPLARQIYLLTLLEHKDDPLSLEDALRFTIRRMGVVEFASLIKEKKQNVDKFLSEKRKLKLETLDKYLAPFGLQVVLNVKKTTRQKKAA